ncbi:MGH1-like glycoside hydrolase domain-containing protein [Zobellia nedashkovskayae]|uniref:MGH1-like glycoside hydrolase domain-containing protein n=1 Tax=Zobellia nedashkovskayae TaxID=2779510 RepID=UPI00188BE21F|nr:trehalase family glycosidase [Zobellia nedashkovskayae]
MLTAKIAMRLPRRFFLLLAISIAIWSCTDKPSEQEIKKQNKDTGWEQLITEANTIGKPEWRPMLQYVAELHKKSTHEAVWPFEHEWEEIGPGYIYGPAFGHWDIVNQAIDVVNSHPEHAIKQMFNNIKNQEADGLIPGSIWMPNAESDSVTWDKKIGHPPFWPFAVEDYRKVTGNDSIINHFYSPLIRQITWFENNRKAEGEGFFYNDILLKEWESGIDEGIRFDDTKDGKFACIDATCHVYFMYQMASKWSKELNLDNTYFEKRSENLKKFIQTELYSEEEGLFFDSWAMKDPSLRSLAFETLFPIVFGVATQEQADRLIDDYLLDSSYFNTAHPVATVGKRDPKFELRMWRGPSWNSMTYWIARGCTQYGREDATKILMEKALDQSSVQFEKTGTIWEFYHPLGGSPKDVLRKPQTEKNEPCKDYLGHNPLIEMTRLYDSVKK